MYIYGVLCICIYLVYMCALICQVSQTRVRQASNILKIHCTTQWNVWYHSGGLLVDSRQPARTCFLSSHITGTHLEREASLGDLITMRVSLLGTMTLIIKQSSVIKASSQSVLLPGRVDWVWGKQSGAHLSLTQLQRWTGSFGEESKWFRGQL